jgi:calcineurin-like phosphoesterase family protein
VYLSNTFFIADTHFHHKNILTFENGRKEFSSVEEMDETMVQRWNNVVKDTDIVYHLGDVTFRTWDIVERLKGNKRLVLGNHDGAGLATYQRFFKKVFGVKDISGAVLSHAPLHSHHFYPRWPLNIHGHTHRDTVMRDIGTDIREADTRYFCVSVEQINYTPISVEEIRKKTGVDIL